MTYKLIKKLSDLEDKIEDWKHEMCSEEELRKAIFDCYKALDEEIKLKEVE